MKNSIVILLSFCITSLKAQEIPSFTVSKDRQFHYLTHRKAEALKGDFPFSLYVYKSKKKQCAKNSFQIINEFNKIIKDSLFLKQLDWLQSSVEDSILSKDLYVVLDDFGENPHFLSFYVHQVLKKPIDLISIDCLTRSQPYWSTYLIHELTHYILRKKNLPSWFEEGLAQTIEINLQGSRPLLSINRLKESHKIPDFFIEPKPFKDPLSYGMSFLFVNYLKNHFGGEALLKEMIRSSYSKNFLKETITSIANKDSLNLSSEVKEKFTPLGILRHFAAAFAIGNSKKEFFDIQYWKGFSWSINFPKRKEMIQPMGFRIYSGTRRPFSVNSELEYYQVFHSFEQYQFLPGIERRNRDPLFYLILNPTLKPLPVGGAEF
ncbi:MAG: hypothetical protein CL678_10540 [Bdellovibrionaceae bacterium]|nr:hypothetical protein [Pseudobdellovibrionaceae bacterium]